ncbi:hypothetical protein DFH28DRAFT_951691 [Melampsora americana]|nr:hypothetical protein DFH28DRAFT_951691 [Melampsora americana]
MPTYNEILPYDAPHGRAANTLGFNVNGSVAWFLMELVSPVTCIMAACVDINSDGNYNFNLSRIWTLSTARLILLLAFLLHYFNRTVVSTFRNPSRSRMHIIVPVMATMFNLLNGYLIGTSISGRCPPAPTQSSKTIASPVWSWAMFYLCMGGWAVGFASNIIHDEILYDLRRSSVGTRKYSIPHGFLYSKPFGGVSCPNYLTELLEWFSFANAAYICFQHLEQPNTICDHSVYDSPPGLFFLAMLGVLIPRAIRTHNWYKEKFGEGVPKNRRAIIPGLL